MQRTHPNPHPTNPCPCSRVAIPPPWLDAPDTNDVNPSTSHRAAHVDIRTYTVRWAHVVAWCRSTYAWPSPLRSCPTRCPHSWSAPSSRRVGHTSSRSSSVRTANSHCGVDGSSSIACADAGIRRVAIKQRYNKKRNYQAFVVYVNNACA